MLNRRVSEWVGNDRSPRFLLPLIEYWQIARQRPYLIWGEARKDKEALLQKTRRQWQIQAGLCCLMALFVLAGYTGYRAYISRDDYQIDRMAQHIQSVALNDDTTRKIPEWCTLLTVAGRLPEAIQAADKIPDDSSSKADAYAAIAEAMAKAGKFTEAMQAADKMKDDSKANTYAAIAEAMAQAGKHQEARSEANVLLSKYARTPNETTPLAAAAKFLAAAGDFQRAVDISASSDWLGRPNALNDANRFDVYLFILKEYLRQTKPDALKIWEDANQQMYSY